MLEIILCSAVTILPDFLFRRFVQKRHINLFSVWYELRYGITACLILTVLLITVVFYNHPSTSRAALYFRAVPVLSETNGRVAEVFVKGRDRVEAGQPLFRLDTTEEEARAETARRRVAEVDAELQMAAADLAAADGQVTQAEGALKQVEDELRTKTELRARNSTVVTEREIERLQTARDSAQGAVAASMAARAAAATRLDVLLPAQRASAQAQLAEALVAIDKATVRAGTSGLLEQFTVRVGEIVNPMLRPGGVLIPDRDRERRIAAGFGQIEAQVIKPGMYAEVTCPALPLTIIPMVVVEVQEATTAGQVRASDQLVDIAQIAQQPGTILAVMEPLYEGGIDALPLGSVCVANAYTSNHDLLASGEVTGLRAAYLHAVDALALVHGLILRAQALFLPVKTLVLTGGH
jgi:multidrug resistance efflux pump